MKAVLYNYFGERPTLTEVPDPSPPPHGVVVRVKATGLCRSDWHGWQGHDKDIVLPHVPGHEFAGVVAAVGSDVGRFRVGDRVTAPFVCGCGSCDECRSGNHQVCPKQTQPGFTHWGSFAELVSVHHADVNLVRLPDDIGFDEAASLGCRFVTAFRALVDQAAVSEGEWVAVHGCGGVGLSAIMIARALGASVIAVDISDDKLNLARSMGASIAVNARQHDSVPDAVREATDGGAHVSMDALGSTETCNNSIRCLRKRGRHVQVGLLLADHANPPIPMDRVIADELEIRGSHGIQAFRYDAVFDMIRSADLDLGKLIGRRIELDQAADALSTMDRDATPGVTLIRVSS